MKHLNGKPTDLWWDDEDTQPYIFLTEKEAEAILQGTVDKIKDNEKDKILTTIECFISEMKYKCQNSDDPAMFTFAIFTLEMLEKKIRNMK